MSYPQFITLILALKIVYLNTRGILNFFDLDFSEKASYAFFLKAFVKLSIHQGKILL